MQIIGDLKIKWYFDTKSETNDVKIEFKTAKSLRDFINGGERLIKVDNSMMKILKINKLGHTSLNATIQKITLREYNLEKLL